MNIAQHWGGYYGAPLFIGKTFNCSLDSVCTDVVYIIHAVEDIARRIYVCTAHKSQVYVCIDGEYITGRELAYFIFSLVCPPCAVYVDELVGDTRENAFPPPRRGKFMLREKGLPQIWSVFWTKILTAIFSKENIYTRPKGKAVKPSGVKVDANWVRGERLLDVGKGVD